jgi:hypothetical protein
MLILTGKKDIKYNNSFSKILHFQTISTRKYISLLTHEAPAKVCNLSFDRLRVNGVRLKLFSFSVRGELVEPQKNTFARGSHIIQFF